MKTLYLNFKMLPFSEAIKIPIVIFGKCSLVNLSGKIKFESSIKFGMLGLGQRYEIFKAEAGIAELNIQGSLILKDKAQFGYDYKIFVAPNAELTIGNMASMASSAKIICTKKITLGDFCRMGSECQLIDTNFHDLKNVVTNELYVTKSEIILGNYNFISNRVTIMAKAKTPDYCTVASNSLLTKNYTALGENCMIGGIPAKLLRQEISRDWETEKTSLKNYLIIKL